MRKKPSKSSISAIRTGQAPLKSAAAKMGA